MHCLSRIFQNNLIYKLLSMLVFMLVQLPVSALEVVVTNKQGEAISEAVVVIQSIDGKQPQVSAKGLDVAVMDQVDKKFVPKVLLVQQGQQVVFPNSDQVRHHVYSFSEAKRFEIKLYEGIPPDPVGFDKPGIVVLGCNIHDSMLGFIYVADSPLAAVSAQDGHLSLDLDPYLGAASGVSLSVWHPWLGAGSEPEIMDKNIVKGQQKLTLVLDVASPEPPKRFGDRFRSDSRF